jgi:predicted DNA-binding antitoxin AbrB/MazE fold protein
MTTVDAIFRKGAFEPIGLVNLPEECRVTLQVEPVEPTAQEAKAMGAVYEIMSRRFRSGRHDLAERHNEHQP